MPVGQRAPTLNMSKLLRQIGFRTGQSRKITYYRDAIYGRDAYGVENTTIAVNELQMPNVQAYIRTMMTKNFTLEREGSNVVGAAMIYLPRLSTLKGFPNFDQSNNIYFNDVEGFDTIIDTDNNILQIATSGTTGWTGTGCTLTSDGEALTATLTATGATIEYAGDLNTLEAGRIAFQAQASGGVHIKNIHSYNGGTTDETPYVVNYENATGVPVYTTDYLPVDIPWGSGNWTDVNSSTTSASGTTSIYASGTRYQYLIKDASGTNAGASGFNYNYVNNLRKFRVTVSGTIGNTIKLRQIRYYCPIYWQVQGIKEYNDEYMALKCIRTYGPRQSLRRAYGE
jgi:hypothetical protein